jgi:hypothetical protein
MSSFVTQEWSEVRVKLDSATALDITLPQGEFTDVVEVTGEAPVIDPTQVNMEQVFDVTYLKNAAIGSGGRSYQSMLYQAAGADSSVEAAGNPSVFGSTSGENTYYIDGMDTTDPITSTFAHNFNFDAIQEIQLQTGGYEAEYGRAIGGVVNLVTKSGGNRFSGTLDARYLDDSFYESGTHFDPSTQETKQYNVAATLGGPLARDKLWFFVAYETVVSDQTPTFSNNTYGFSGDYPFAKLSWQANPSWRVVARYSGDPVDIENANAFSSSHVDPNTMAFRDQGGYVAGAEINAVLSEAMLWNVNGGIKRSTLDQIPYQDPTVLSHWSYATGLYTDNEYRQDYSSRDRNELSTDLTWFLDGSSGSHEIKGGLEYGKFMENDSTICSTGQSDQVYGCNPGTEGIQFLDHARYEDFQHPYYMYVEKTIPPQDFVGDMYSAFIQDAWRPTANLTIKAGVRFDDMTWSDNDGTERIWFEKTQPRVGFAYDIGGNAKNVIRGSWGRFMHPANSSVPGFLTTVETGRNYWASCLYGLHRLFGLPTGLTTEECQGWAEVLEWDYRTDPDGWDSSGWVGPFFSIAGEPTEVDPNLNPAYADEWTIAYERALWDRASIEFSYIAKDTEDIIEDTCRGNFYDGPSEDADCGAFLIANIPERTYSGATVKFETRTLDWLTLIASYTYGHSIGSADTRHYFWADFDSYPWNFMNMYGYTMMQRRHRLKLNGFVLLPYDFTIGFDGFWADKFHYNSIDDEFPGAPPTNVYAEPRGSRQANTNYQLDLQVSKGFNPGPVRLELIATVINVFSTERPTDANDICENVHGCSTADFGGAIEWQNPRRYEVGVRLEF